MISAPTPTDDQVAADQHPALEDPQRQDGFDGPPLDAREDDEAQQRQPEDGDSWSASASSTSYRLGAVRGSAACSRW